MTCTLVVATLAGCGGGTLASVGGTLSGLNSGLNVVVQNNLHDTLTLNVNQGFSFPSLIPAEGNYSVTVLTQPVGQSCSVTNGTGRVNSNADAVTNVSVTCVNSASVGGTLSGLPSGTAVTLSTNGQTLSLSQNSFFSFPGVLAVATVYTVTIVTQPAGHACTVSNPSGTVVSGALSQVQVTCI
jgi:hypothetical protein